MSACYCTGACMRLGHCPNAVGEPFGLRSRILPAEPASPYHSRERVRVRAWRQPNEDDAGPDVVMARHILPLMPRIMGREVWERVKRQERADRLHAAYLADINERLGRGSR